MQGRKRSPKRKWTLLKRCNSLYGKEILRRWSNYHLKEARRHIDGI